MKWMQFAMIMVVVLGTTIGYLAGRPDWMAVAAFFPGVVMWQYRLSKE